MIKVESGLATLRRGQTCGTRYAGMVTYGRNHASGRCAATSSPADRSAANSPMCHQVLAIRRREDPNIERPHGVAAC